MTSVLAALINGAVLSAPLTVAVWLGLRLVPRRGLNAATRYVVWWATLAIASILPTAYLPNTRSIGSGGYPSQLGFRSRGRRVDVPVRIGRTARPATPPVDDSAVSVRTAVLSDAPRSGWQLFPFELTAGHWPQWVIASWVLVTVLLLIRLTVSYVLLGRRKGSALAAPAHLAARMEEWLARCRCMRRGVRVVVSAEVSAPVAAGPCRPSILIPARLFDELEEAELEQIGLHEAAHLARGDDYALIVQRVVEALFALHPIVRWITRQIDLEREIACDDFVVQAIGRPREYAACLTHLVELTGGVRASLVAAAATEENSHLSRRVDMLLDKTRHPGTRLLKTRLTAIVAALVGLAWTAAKTPQLIAFTTPRSEMVERASTLRIPAHPQDRQASPAPITEPEREGPQPLIAQSPHLPATDRTTQPGRGSTTPSPLLSTAAQGSAQQTPAVPQTPAHSNQPAALVSISVEVTDPRNRFVTGLDKDNFRLFEDGVEQEIARFSSEDNALSVGIVFDISGSVGGRFDQSRQAVGRFFEDAHPKDEFFLVQFTDRPHLITGFTTNAEQIRDRLTLKQSNDKAALLEGIYMAVREMNKARNPRKILLVISDEINSRYPKSEIESLAREENIQVYGLGISEPAVSPYVTQFGDGYVSGPALLGEVTRQTGGRFFVVENFAQAPDVAARMSVELRNLYMLEYSPKNTIRDGQYRKVHVELVQPRGLPPLETTFRPGYYAPAQ
jgi:Ca-activated chloride channel homolog